MLKSIIRIINCLIPKNQYYIYMRSYSEYKDNVHAVLDEIVKNNLNTVYTIYCDGPAFKSYKKFGVKLVKPGSALSLWHFFRSKFAFCDIGMFLSTKPVQSQKIINVWHGAPLKRIGYYMTNMENNKDNIPVASIVVSVSKYFSTFMAKAFGIPEEYVAVTGQPRNDYFFSNQGSCLKKFGIYRDVFSKVVIWMPTYRINSVDKSVDGKEYPYGIPLINDNNLAILYECLERNNILLIIKAHALQAASFPNNLKCKNILFMTSEDVGNKKIALYELLAECDALITDYSSVYFDYLCLNRPICFAYDDFEEYINNRGFVIDNAIDIMPGQHVRSIDEMINFLSDIANDVDKYEITRDNTRKKLCDFFDNQNSLRLLKYLGLLK